MGKPEKNGTSVSCQGGGPSADEDVIFTGQDADHAEVGLVRSHAIVLRHPGDHRNRAARCDPTEQAGVRWIFRIVPAPKEVDYRVSLPYRRLLPVKSGEIPGNPRNGNTKRDSPLSGDDSGSRSARAH